jgi:hypothetical protein
LWSDRNHLTLCGIRRWRASGGERRTASSEEYRRHAGECVRLAQQIQNAKDKAMLLAMAETWLRLAKQTESGNKEKPE